MTRSTTATSLRRLYSLLAVLDGGGKPSRQDLARRWKVTTRAVSHLIASAERRFAVRIRDEGDGYALHDPGVFDLRRVKEVAR